MVGVNRAHVGFGSCPDEPPIDVRMAEILLVGDEQAAVLGEQATAEIVALPTLDRLGIEHSERLALHRVEVFSADDVGE